MPKKIVVDEYLMPDDYNSALPPYFYEVDGALIDDEMILSAELEQIVQRNKGEKLDVLEFGFGTARMTKHILPVASRYRGADISPEMARYAQSELGENGIDFMTMSANEFIDGGEKMPQDLVCSFWAFNYALLSHFEHMDHRTKVITPVDNLEDASEKTNLFVSDMVSNMVSGSEGLFFYFDPYSEEQNFVTKVWETFAPFPNNDRGHTLKVFNHALGKLDSKGVIDYTCTKHDGHVYFPDESKLVEGFFNLHFKGILNECTEEPRVVADLLSTMKPYSSGEGEFKVPAGLYVVNFRKG